MITFSDYKYVYEHGEKPRGFGMWAFYLPNIKDTELTRLNCPFKHYVDNKWTIVWASETMTLTQAKQQIKTWLFQSGFRKELVYIAD